MIHNTEHVSLSVSSSRYFCIASNLVHVHCVLLSGRPTKRWVEKGSAHPMSCGTHDIGCADHQLLNSSQKYTILWPVIIRPAPGLLYLVPTPSPHHFRICAQDVCNRVQIVASNGVLQLVSLGLQWQMQLDFVT